jgi:protein SCO1/2/putative membrane protein
MAPPLALLSAIVLNRCADAATFLNAEDAYPAPDFSLTERSGRTVTKADLHGKVWVACFFFTSCNTICPQITQTMARLQEDLHKRGYNDVVLVSFSVDPDTDTPDVLKRYAADHGADPDRWLFLTGKNDDEVHPVVKGFQLPVKRTEGKERVPGNEFSHSSRLVLVDQEGRIRGYCDGRQFDEEHQPVDDLPQLEKEIARLRGSPRKDIGFPELNAALNATAFVLLIAGYVAIKSGRIGLHKTCMLTALAVSAAFLASYLFYHLVVRSGQVTRFTGPEPARSIYLAILLTHTVLAAVVAPLALVTAVLGLVGWLTAHRRIAWVTLPIWLYVSITGVVVYLMLYRLYPSA